MAQEMKKGLFITFEGPEGSGKSTHSKLIFESLKKDGFDAIHTFEPGDTSLGKRIRNILLEKEDIKVGHIAELFLFETDRAQHVEEIIIPAMKNKKIIICDRFNTATLAYQGYGLDQDLNMVKDLDAIARGGIDPDLVILLDTDVRSGLKRASGPNGADKMEKRSLVFHDKVRDGYLTMAEQEPDIIKIVQIQDTIEKTYSRIREIIYDFIKGYIGTE